MNLDDLIIATFCEIDDAIKACLAQLPQARLRQRGMNSTFSDSQVLTIEVIDAYLGLEQECRTARYTTILCVITRMLEWQQGLVLGDRNYHPPTLQEQLQQENPHVQLLTPYKNKKHDPQPQQSRILAGFRYRIETVDSQLCGRLGYIARPEIEATGKRHQL